MGTIALSLPVTGLPNSTEDPKVTNDLTLIQNVINGNLDGSNVATTAGFVRLVPTTMGSNGTAVAGTLVGAVPGVTVTLPAPAANIAVGVYAGVGVTGANPVTVSGTNIYGVGLSAASSFKLGVPIAAVVLQSDGANWFVVSGQQDTGWLALSLASSVIAAPGYYVPSARLLGDRVSLKGGMKNTTGASILAGATWGTVPAGLRPTGLINAPGYDDANGLDPVTVSTAGLVFAGLPVTNNHTLALDNITYSLS